jgi:hypothetical protein
VHNSRFLVLIVGTRRKEQAFLALMRREREREASPSEKGHAGEEDADERRPPQTGEYSTANQEQALAGGAPFSRAFERKVRLRFITY